MKTTLKENEIPSWIRRVGIITAWLCFFVCGSAQAASDAGDRILGYWLTADGGSKIQITQTNSLYYGTVVWVAPKPPQPPGPAEKSATVGEQVLSGFKYDDRADWIDGKIYVPARSRHFDGRLHLRTPDALEVRVSSGIVKKTVVWTRLH